MKILQNIKLPTSYGKVILIDIFYKEDNCQKPVIIFAHGIKSFKDWGPFDLIAKQLAEAGFIFLKFNFSHGGTTLEKPDQIGDLESFANNNIQIELENLESVINWVASNNEIPEEEIQRDAINLVGHSRGGSLAIIKAAGDDRIKKLVTWAAFNDFDWVFNHFFDVEKWKEEGVFYSSDALSQQKLPRYYQHYENYLENMEEFCVKNAVEKLKIPTLLLHGTEDEVVPFEHSIEMKRWNKKLILSLIPNGSHRFDTYHPYLEIELPFNMAVAVKETSEFLQKK